MTDISELEALPDEIFEEILSYLSDTDVLHLCQTNKNISRYCDPSFWAHRALSKGYIKNIDEFKDKESWPKNKYRERTAQERYLKLLSKKDCVAGSEKYIRDWINICPFRAGKKGDKELINYFLNKGAKVKWALIGAAKGGYLDIVKYLIDEKGATNIDYALSGAAEGGHLDLVKYLVEEKGAANIDGALHYAALIGHIDLINYFLNNGGYINIAIEGLAYGGYLDLVKYLINKGANVNYALIGAAGGGHLDIVKYLIDEKGATDIDDALRFAAEGGYLEIVKYLIEEKGCTNLNEALEEAIFKEHLDMVKYLENIINERM